MGSASIFRTATGKLNMIDIPAKLRQRFRAAGQDHVFEGWTELTEVDKQSFLSELDSLDLALLGELYASRDKRIAIPDPAEIAPVPIARLDDSSPEAQEVGEDAIRRGHVAVLMVAGGQGSRLGFDHPKGMFPIGPISLKSLFQIHAEKVLALRRHYESALPFLVLTSPSTHDETEDFFHRHRNFGLPEEDVFLFRQGTMPALDVATGKLLLESPGHLFLSPNGHGGVLPALRETGLLDTLRDRGIRQLFYFQVDNPLVKVADPAFLAHHLHQRAMASSKIVAREDPQERLGNLVTVHGRCMMIEYSDLPDTLARQRDEHGRLRLWAGSPAIHCFELDFIERLTRGSLAIPFHTARKKVPFFQDGRQVVPDHENALKFEMFIFDVLPLAESWTVVESMRAEEFVPLKNASGPDSPDKVREALCNRAAAWLEEAGIAVPRDGTGGTLWPLEISPLFARDARELRSRLSKPVTICSATHFV
jgi:UDP-N-acetylglucosamine/UDP-N-acetylgalactosamine diphosphorylase